MKGISTLLGLSAIALLAAAPVAQAQSINGAGSSFAAPIYQKWAEAAAGPTGVKLNYQSIGSGGGINQITNRTVDFGASDMPLPSDKLTSAKLFQFPTVIGGVVIIVNIPGIKPNELHLSGPLLADIYLGKIQKWNDPAIEAVNKGLKLPSLAIAPVYRADASGTTFVFTDYLSKISPEWKSQVGSATSVKWAVGAGAKGSEQVSGTVRNIRGGIGYVESAYAETNHLTTTLLKNHAGRYIAPTMAAFQAAAGNADWKDAQNFAIDLNDEPGNESWPIESATFVLLPTNPTNAAQQAAVLKFFGWSLNNGDEIAKQLLYVPLPASTKAQIQDAWKSVLAMK
jgi:phosphate transport system substrate-binding protein